MARIIDLKAKKEEVLVPVEIPKQEVIEVPKSPLAPVPLSRPGLPDSLSWTTPAVHRNQNTRVPYIFAGLLVVGAILVGIFQKDILFAVLLALMGIMVVVYRRKAPAEVSVEITPLKVTIDGRSYSYEQIKSFWIQYEPEYDIRELSLQFKKWYLPYAKIPLGGQDPVQVRGILIQFIPEVEHKETLLQSFVRLLGI